ncbi:hypothetical protein Verru16b_02950 [Lacunisphaera limnophila]|uniref:MetA-pathway of phenol degradation n=1 Tax=Lacunisphaera limnophila TaxID=1838286 RepID=A0A1D8AY84_9BACT|nr:transporter [Lacunisphaera limnophila]AOS45859.1 hypothetical protein Verru16b_02950 [Lacunisphaera limnophila]
MYKPLRPALVSLALLLAAGALSGQITEHPSTVAPGRFLVEMDALSLTFDREPGFKYTALGAASTFLTTGLTDNWDVQVGADLFISQKVDSGGLTDRDSGIGDVYVRTKWRFYEDTATGTQVAIIPFVKMPTNSGNVGNDAVEGGIILPWTTNLAAGFHCDVMAEVDFLRNNTDDGYDLNFYFSGSLSRELTSAIGIYGEAALAKASDGSKVSGIMGGGVTLAISENTWWDLAVYKGISDGAPDWNHVLRFNFGF